MVRTESENPDRIGRYDVQARLGTGGMARVYLAYDEKLERRVAVKVMDPGRPRDELDLERFRREAMTVARLRRPNIATVHDYDHHEGAPYIAMELVSGLTLRELLLPGPLPVDDTLSILVQVARALEAAHSEGVVHRDVKPGNVMVGTDGHATVLDFGISRLAPTGRSATSSGPASTISGTPDYMSPEQAEGRGTTLETDVWSLAVVLVECLTGSRPSPSNDQESWDPPGWPRNAPPRIRRLVIRSLRESPSRRPTMQEFRQELERARAELLDTRSRRRRWISLTLAVGLVMAIGVAVAQLTSVPDRRWDVDTVTREPSGAGHVLVGRADGEKRWELGFPGTDGRLAPLYPQRLNHDRDVENPVWATPDGTSRYVFAASNPSGRMGTVRLIDASSGMPLWERPCECRATEAMDGVHWVSGWRHLVPWPAEDDPVFAIQNAPSTYYWTCVDFVTVSNRRLASYHHPGHVYFHMATDLDGDGVDEFLFNGVNNRARDFPEIQPFESNSRYPLCVFALRSGDISGQAFPYTDWTDLEPAREFGYLLIPLVSAETRAHVRRITALADGGLLINVTDGRNVRTDADLNPTWVQVTNGTRADSALAEDTKSAVFFNVAEGRHARRVVELRR